jgi:hypothetical protein
MGLTPVGAIVLTRVGAIGVKDPGQSCSSLAQSAANPSIGNATTNARIAMKV